MTLLNLNLACTNPDASRLCIYFRRKADLVPKHLFNRELCVSCINRPVFREKTDLARSFPLFKCIMATFVIEMMPLARIAQNDRKNF